MASDDEVIAGRSAIDRVNNPYTLNPKGPRALLHPEENPACIYDPSKWDSLTKGDWSNLAKSMGYTGKNPFKFLYGMETKNGSPVPHGQYGAGAANHIGDYLDALDAYTQKHNPALRNEYLSGYQRS